MARFLWEYGLTNKTRFLYLGMHGYGENSLDNVHLTVDELIGSHQWEGGLDLLNIVLIGIPKKPPKHDDKYEHLIPNPTVWRSSFILGKSTFLSQSNSLLTYQKMV